MLDEALQKKLINTGREFMHGYIMDDPYEDFESDQDLKKPQPPLVKAAVTPAEAHIPLTRDFSSLKLNNDLNSVIRDRRSSRVFTPEALTLDELAFLLWATQGVKDIRGKAYATIRTVPCGGARHEFETYLLVRNVEGLVPGRYHYLPMEHALEFLGEVNDIEKTISETLCEQSWCAKCAVAFYWSMVAYRAEWRYGISAHRVALIDAGHLGQNLYIACAGLGIGTCGIGAFMHDLTADALQLDGEEEYVVYAAPVGRVSEKDAKAEKAFYQFVEDEGL